MAKTIYIAGLGLIGASMALGIKRDHPDYEILGYNRSQASRDIALKKGMIDRATDDFASFAPLADVIILTLPIKQTIAFIKELADLDLKEGVIISDAGSTKSDIVDAAEQYLAGKMVRFVGAHPMAGSHKTGAASADVNLFENAYYIFTPSSLTSPDTLEEMKDLLSGLHARFIEIDAKEHDRVTSQISHFPHILASGLMEQTAVYAREHEMTRRFAAGGFRDMTRIAESEPGMWTSILLSNREAIIERIEDFKERLDGIGQAISKGEEEQIWNFFNQAREQRQAMEIHKRGGVDSSYDLYVDVPDEEDVILQILELLRGTSLVNIHINEENREDVHGILQISFKNAQDLERAERLITENTDYTVVIK
ncbi:MULTISPECIES: prephenate dehydrogenase [Streptococcus]|uniref:Prephenate dehydrogenase n=1 Tax=Streptococcus mitis bv. 2 str. F0392 TaxID=768726 RepID=F9P087_STROR|nr:MULTISPECIES: prephenate dehydrogenase [Streptococcus]EGR93626.1 prephenate dehydrogenase [Streptococcus mitis bv. 2 str. F0392]RSJ03634.1 prephenate dehydrogenase [Streptococcus mitis]